VHFSRLVARGPAGTHHGQEERNRSQIEHIDESAALLAMVKPSVIILAHTATSYTLGLGAEADLLRRLQAQYAMPFATAFGSVAAALGELGVKRVALGTPYSEEITLMGKGHLERHGFEVVSHRRLENVTGHLRGDGGAGLPAWACRGYADRTSRLSQRNRHADHHDP
jgi:maleate isomerase